MKILFVSAEVNPFAKVGGLGDVAGSLPKFIKKMGHDIRVILPYYGTINNNHQEDCKIEDVPDSSVELEFDGNISKFSLKKCVLPNTNVPVYFVVSYELFGQYDDIYPANHKENFQLKRFIVFSYATLKLVEKINFKPDIIHCNDWHVASIPMYLKSFVDDNIDFFKGIKTLYTIHNLSYQGRSSPDILKFTKIDADKFFHMNGLEFYGKVNWMKGGIIYADKVNTVSENYAKEIQTQEYGEDLDGVLRANSKKLSGILNGVDYSIWNPETDQHIIRKYSKKDLKGKNSCKISLQREYDLEANPYVPVIGMVSRMVEQKGFDLLERILYQLKVMNLQLVILGRGDKKYEKLLLKLNESTSNIRVKTGFNEIRAEKIYAGADMFLLPSRFEPCGLSQLIALKYGTIPIVRKTGGLADTIVDYSSDDSGNGFMFGEYTTTELLNTIKSACKYFENKNLWGRIIMNALSCDFGWQKSAKLYEKLYKDIKREEG